jgi:hypothetical protein
MRHLLIAGVIVLTTTTVVPAQTKLEPVSAQPINLTLTEEARIGDALATVARLSGVTLEFDASVTEEMQHAKLTQRIRLNGATLEGAISALTSSNGLTYTITGPKAIRVSKKV